MQAAPEAGGLLLLLAALVILGHLCGLLVQGSRGRLGSVRYLAASLTVLAALYGAILVGVGLLSSPRQLGAGDVKCFDDWCASFRSSQRTASTELVQVHVRIENHGRGRPMRSSLARAYVGLPGGETIAPLDGTPMQTEVGPGGHADVELSFPARAATMGARFVVAEGSDTIGPGTFTIGDEVSPFHARAGWPLSSQEAP